MGNQSSQEKKQGRGKKRKYGNLLKSHSLPRLSKHQWSDNGTQTTNSSEQQVDTSHLKYQDTLLKPTMTNTNFTTPLPSPPPGTTTIAAPLNSARRDSVASSLATTSTGKAMIDDLIERLLEPGYVRQYERRFCLNVMEIDTICDAAMDIFLQQPTLLDLSPPVRIVGDIHGQYSDLLRLFQMTGPPPASNYLFLGDYVDRGKQSLETMLLLLCYKIKYPETFFLLRGNHENQNVTKVYGFYDECKRRLNVKIWRLFINVFNTLPVAALVGNRIFCVHGGLSPSLTSMDDIRRIERPIEVPEHGFLLNDLLWSDPSDTVDRWEDNERGVSYCFGKKVLDEFLAKFDLDLVCRAHMVVEDGYEFFNDRTLVTLFSASNYCDFDNKAAVMTVDEDMLCSFQLLSPATQSLYDKSQGLMRNPSSSSTQIDPPF